MRKVLAFLREVRAELAKVVWPSRRRAVQLTVVVIIATIAAGAFLAAVDFGLSKGIEYVIDTSQKKGTGTAQNPPAGTSPVQVPVSNQQPQPKK